MSATFDLNAVLDYVLGLVVQVIAMMRTQILFTWHGFSISLFQLLLSFLVVVFFFSVFFPHVYPDDDD